MTSANAGEDRAKQQPSDTVEDLQPREDESAGLKGGFNPQPDPPGRSHGAGGGGGAG